MVSIDGDEAMPPGSVAPPLDGTRREHRSTAVRAASTRRPEHAGADDPRVGWAAALVAAAVGIAGPVAAVRSWGVVVVADDEAAVGQRWIVAVALAIVVVRRLLRGHPVAAAALTACVAAGGVLGTAPNVGRAPMLLAVIGVLVAEGALVDRHPVSWVPARRHRVAVLALVPLVGAEILWVTTSSLVATVAADLVALVVLGAHHLRPDAVARVDEPVRRAAASSLRGLRVTARTVDPRPALRVLTRWARSHRDALVEATIGLAVAAVWAPTFWRLSGSGDGAIHALGINDYPLHVDLATRFSLVPLHIEAPHLLFHAVTRSWATVVGVRAAPTAALVTATAASYLALVWLLRARSGDRPGLPRRWARGVAVAYFAMETPTLALIGLHAVSGSTPFWTLQWWGNPTWLAGLPFLFLTPPLVDAVLAGTEHPDTEPAPPRLRLALVTVVGLLAKPGLGFMLIPALPLYLIAVRRVSWRTFRTLMATAVVPAVVVVAWQTWFLAESDASRFSSGWTLDPIVEPVFGFARMGPLYWLPLLWIGLALWMGRGRFLADRTVQLTLIALAFGIVMMLTVRETGTRALHGNFAVPAQACLTLLIVLAIKQVALTTRGRITASSRVPAARRTTAPIALSATTAAVFLVGGALSWADSTGLIHLPIRWLQAALAR